MSEFDRYRERLRQRAGITLGEDTERELRAHFEEAVAAWRRAGRSQQEAELAALDELGKPDVIARAFRAEQRALRRLVGGPPLLVADLARRSRRFLAAAVVAGALGALAARAAPPTYTVRVPLAVSIRMDYGSELAARMAITQMRLQTLLPVHLDWTRHLALAVTGTDRTTALAVAQQATEEAEEQFPLYYQRTLYGNGDYQAVVIPGAPQVETTYPELGGAIGGGVLGIGGLATFTRRRKRARQ